MSLRFISSIKGRAAAAISSCKAARIRYSGHSPGDRASNPVGGGSGPLWEGLDRLHADDILLQPTGLSQRGVWNLRVTFDMRCIPWAVGVG